MIAILDAFLLCQFIVKLILAPTNAPVVDETILAILGVNPNHLT
jgi:hypothetical protein